MIAAVTKLSPAQAVATAPEWWWLGRNFSYPRYNTIALKMRSEPDDPPPVLVADVFRALGLEPLQLQFVFDWRVEGFPINTFEQLGACPADDQRKWSYLACLLGKTIHFCNHHGDRFYRETAVYYPDGRVELKESKNKNNN